MFVGKEVKVDKGVKEGQKASIGYQSIIISYITKEQWRGFKREEIEEALKKAGWPKHVIEEAFVEAAKHPMHRYRKRILISIIVVIILFLVVFILSSSALYFVIENIVYIVISIGLAIIGFIIWLYVRSKQQKNRKIDEAPRRTLEAKPGQYETDIDLLYKILMDKKRMKLSEVMGNFGVTEKHALEWAKILENHGLAKLKYPAFGEPELVRV